jgi:putative transcriptional regulator
MDKQMFNELKESIKQATAISREEAEPARRIIYTDEEVKAIRERLDLSQTEFAKLIQVNVRTLQNWEQGRRYPTGPAAALLKLVNGAPEVAMKVLHA